MRRIHVLMMAAVVLFGCGDRQGREGEVTYHEARGQYLFHHSDGVLASVTINHEEIPGFMEAMAMSFPLENPSLVEGLGAGQEIVFRIAVQPDGSFRVDRIGRVETPAGLD